jgi:hypothetical protein
MESSITVNTGKFTAAGGTDKPFAIIPQAAASGRHCNTAASIWHLPSEILLLIFLSTRWADKSGRGFGWIAVSQVCRHWRNPAIGYPRLWA